MKPSKAQLRILEAMKYDNFGYGLYFDPSDNSFFIEDRSGERLVLKRTMDIMLREGWIKRKDLDEMSGVKPEFRYYVFELTPAGRAALLEAEGAGAE